MMASSKFIVDGMVFDLSFVAGRGIDFAMPLDQTGLPNCAGIYALVHHPRRLVTVGEGVNVRNRYRKRRNWTASGVHKPDQMRRYNRFNPFPIVVAAVECGLAGWEFYLLSTDTRLQPGQPRGCGIRQNTERALHSWLAAYSHYEACNRQRSWPRCSCCPRPTNL